MTRTYEQHAFALGPDTTEVVLVRHGASAAAVPGRPFAMVDGHGDPPLAPQGERQAEAVGRRLALEDVAVLAISGLTRTVQTAAPLAAATGLEPLVVPELREWRLGDWEAGEFRIRMADGDPLALRVVAEERWELIPNAEPAEEVDRRVRAGVERVVAAAGPGRRAVAVVHGGIIGAIGQAATGSRPFAFVGAENGSLTRLLVGPGGAWRLRSFNDTAHLPAAA